MIGKDSQRYRLRSGLRRDRIGYQRMRALRQPHSGNPKGPKMEPAGTPQANPWAPNPAWSAPAEPPVMILGLDLIHGSLDVLGTQLHRILLVQGTSRSPHRDMKCRVATRSLQ
jgi:hypothetical protein